MRYKDFGRGVTRVGAPKGKRGGLRRLTRCFVLVGLGLVMTTKLVIAAPAFKAEVQVTDALLQERTLKTWKHHPYFNDPDYQYLVAARRSDGAVAVITRSPGYPDPKKLYLRANFMKCGVRGIWTKYVPNAAAFSSQLANPNMDDPKVEADPLFEESANEMLYQIVCGK